MVNTLGAVSLDAYKPPSDPEATQPKYGAPGVLASNLRRQVGGLVAHNK